jgi:hypothetical protein
MVVMDRSAVIVIVDRTSGMYKGSQENNRGGIDAI